MSAAALTHERARLLLNRFLDLLADEFGDGVLAVTLYGSVARDVGGPTSDLDLIVVHDVDRVQASKRIVRPLLAVRQTREYTDLEQEGFLPEPAPILLTREDLARHPWTLLDVLDHGIILLDRDGVLRRELDAIRRRLQELGGRKITLPDGTWYWDLKPDWKPGDIIEL